MTTFLRPHQKHPLIKFDVEISIIKFSFLKNIRICCITFKLRDTIEEDLQLVINFENLFLNQIFTNVNLSIIRNKVDNNSDLVHIYDNIIYSCYSRIEID